MAQELEKSRGYTGIALCWWAKAVLSLWRRQQPSNTRSARATSASVEGLAIFKGSTPKIWSKFTTGSSSDSFNDCWNRTGTTVTWPKRRGKNIILLGAREKNAAIELLGKHNRNLELGFTPKKTKEIGNFLKLSTISKVCKFSVQYLAAKQNHARNKNTADLIFSVGSQFYSTAKAKKS